MKEPKMISINEQAEGAPPAASWNESLRARLAAYKAETKMSDAKLALQVGSNAASINRYLNSNPVGDVEKLEAKIADFFDRRGILATAPKVIEGLIETPVIETMMGLYRRVQRTQDFALIIGPAGCGKTEAKKKFQGATITALSINVTRDTRTGYGVERLIVNQLPKKGINNFASSFEFIASKLADSQRLLIVDGGHKLSFSGWETLFDLHDETGIPIVTQGNATMEATIKGLRAKDREKNEQHVSRVGLHYTLEPEFSMAHVEAFTALYFPNASMNLLRLCHRVANDVGHLRALRKHLLLMEDFLSAAHGNDVEAFRMAHSQLLTDVSLRED